MSDENEKASEEPTYRRARLSYHDVKIKPIKPFPSLLLNHEKRPPSLLWELDEPVAQERYPGGREEE